jgi:hypothetical protein
VIDVTTTEKAAKTKPMAPIARIGTYGFMMSGVYGAMGSEGICRRSHSPDFSYLCA